MPSPELSYNIRLSVKRPGTAARDSRRDRIWCSRLPTPSGGWSQADGRWHAAEQPPAGSPITSPVASDAAWHIIIHLQPWSSLSRDAITAAECGMAGRIHSKVPSFSRELDEGTTDMLCDMTCKITLRDMILRPVRTYRFPGHAVRDRSRRWKTSTFATARHVL